MEGTFPCSLNHLVDSHFMFLKLVNEANQIFGVIVGSYFATQVRKSYFSVSNSSLKKDLRFMKTTMEYVHDKFHNRTYCWVEFYIFSLNQFQSQIIQTK